MSLTVRLSEVAVNDLTALRNWVAEIADEQTALAYVDRVAAKFATLSDFPRRGQSRPEVGPDIRSISFERRLIIFYRIDNEEVWIERIVSGARDLGQLH